MNDAQQLKQVRNKLGLTQSEMAREMGYGSQQYVSLIENNERNMSGVAKRCLELLSQKHKIEHYLQQNGINWQQLIQNK